MKAGRVLALSGLLVGLIVSLGVATVSDDGARAQAPFAMFEYSLELAVPGPDGWQFGEIHFYAVDDGREQAVRIAEGRAAMLARFPGALALEGSDASAQFKLFDTPVRWPQPSASWLYNPSGSTAAMPPASAMLAISLGAEGWDNAGGSGFHFDYLGETTTPTGCNGNPAAYVKDGKNVVGWGHIIGGHLGYSCHWRSASLVSDTPFFAIQEIDIIFEPNESYTMGRLRALALHEFGHGLGLDHTPAPGCPGKVMCGGGDADDFTTPQTDDIEGVLALYGEAVVPVPAPPGVRPFKAISPAIARD